jgi:hypothetical protein
MVETLPTVTVTPEDDAVNLPPADDSSVPLPPDVATRRAVKTVQTGLVNQSVPDLTAQFAAGNENLIRKQAATQADFNRKMEMQKQLENFAATKNGPLEESEVQKFLNPYNPANQPADPDLVIERAYAQNTLSSLNTAKGFMLDNLMTQASVDSPQQVQQTQEDGSDLLTKNLYLSHRLENAEALISQQSYAGYGADFAKNLFQPYVEVKLRGQVGSALAGLGLGSNLDEAHYTLYRMPLEEFKATVDKVYANLSKDNPQLARMWLKSMLSQNSWDTALNNTFSAMAVPDYLAVGKVGAKILGKAGKLNQARKATRDLVDAVGRNPDANATTVAEGLGDTHAAAVSKVNDAIQAAAEGHGNPLELAKSTLLSAWWEDAKKFVSNPGTYLSRELVTRTLDDIERDGEALFNELSTSNRPERLPGIINNPENIDKLKDKYRADYRGPANTLLDIDLEKEPVSNTWWWKSRVGNYDGTLFPDVETAKGFANQLGIAEPIVKGATPDKVYVPEAALSKPKMYGPKTWFITPEEQTALRKAVEDGKYGEQIDGDKLRLFTDADNKVFIEGRKEPQPGMIPVEVKGNKIKYHEPYNGERVSTLGEVKQTDKGVRFFKDDGAEILSTPNPTPGHIPYNLKTGKFEPKLSPEQAAIEQQGLGFHIEMWSPLKETDDLTRNLMMNGPDVSSMNSATGTKSVVNGLLGWVRNSEDTLSKAESENRKAVTYAQSNIQKWAHNLAKDLEDVASGRVREDQVTGEKLNPLVVYPKSFFGKIKSRQIAKEFERTLDHSRRMVDPETKEPGYFFKTAGELQDFYLRNFKRDPSYLETKAYFNFAKLVEGDRMMREVSEFRYRARLGTEQHSLTVLDPATGDKIKTPFFDGIREPTFPGGEEYILVMGKNKGDETLYKLGHINDKLVDDLRAKTASGEGKVIRIYDKDHMPLENEFEVANGKLIQYVYTESSETKPIEFNHVNRRGGGHFEWDYDHWLKQADVRAQHNVGLNNKLPGLENVYVGDKTVMPIKNAKMGEDVAKIWNETHPLMAAGRWDEIKPMVAKLGIKYEDFVGWYKAGKDPKTGKPTRPLLNFHEPIVVVPKNKKIVQMSSDLQNRYRIPLENGKYRETFRDATKTGPANNFKVDYNQERNSSISLSTINDIGTEGNPIYQHQPAEMVDPLTTMNRALNRVIQSTFMDDYKISAVEHWLREAGKYIDAEESELRSTPFFHFQNPKYRAGVPKSTIWNLESNRFKINQFVGTPNKFDTWVHDFTSSLADKFYEAYGPEQNRSIFTKAKTIVPIWMLHHVTDPVQFMRSVTFNFKLGLFAIPQFLVQAQTHALIWALEPRHGTAGTFGMLLHAWGSFTDKPAVLASLDNYASKFNAFGSKFRPGEWLEARRELQKSGFQNVAGEYSNINNQLKTRFIMNDFEKGLKLGQYPFRLGEESTRITAWYTAFREWREANPTQAITNVERNKILQKADLLTVNMSRASSSGLNHGVFSLSTQFLTYQIKLAELFWGKRLADTAGQRWLARARIVSLFSALYGLPNAIGVTGAPVADNIREHFMDDLGYIPGEKWLSTMINEGLPAWQMAMITGKLDNVGDRFGSQGFQNIKQALRGDIPWWQAVGGASVSTTAKFLNSALDPFSQYAASWIRGDKTDDRFTIRSADLVEPLKQISSVSTAAKWWTAMQTGKWINSNEQYVTDVSPLHATLLGLTGMSPQEQDDMFIKNQMLKGETEAKKSALRDFIKDWRRGIESKENNDPEQGDAYFRNAMARAKAVGMAPEEINTAIALGNRGYERAIDNTDRNVWLKGDYNKRDQRRDIYHRQLDMKDKQ